MCAPMCLNVYQMCGCVSYGCVCDVMCVCPYDCVSKYSHMCIICVCVMHMYVSGYMLIGISVCACSHVDMWEYVFVYVSMYVSVFLCMYMCGSGWALMSVWICLHMLVSTWLCEVAYLYMFLCHIYMSGWVHVCMHMHECMFVCISYSYVSMCVSLHLCMCWGLARSSNLGDASGFLGRVTDKR